MNKELEVKDAWNGLLDDIKGLNLTLTKIQQKKLLDRLDVIRPYLTTDRTLEIGKLTIEYLKSIYNWEKIAAEEKNVSRNIWKKIEELYNEIISESQGTK